MKRKKRRTTSVSAILLALALGWGVGWFTWWIVAHPNIAANPGAGIGVR